jgi:group I intron endonuclease
MIVYMITNKLNGHSYIGQTVRTIRERWKEHCRTNSDCAAISNAICKYGKENFSIKVLCKVDTLDKLNKEEQRLIKKFNTLKPNGYNLTTGGLGHFFSEETKNKMSKIASGRGNPFFGKRHSKQTKIRMSMARSGKNNCNFGKTFSKESRAKMSKRQIGVKNHFFGRTHTKKTKRKMAKARIAYWKKKKENA